MQDEKKKKSPEKLFVKKKDKLIPIDPDNIHLIKSEGNYLELHLDEQSFMVRDSLKNMEEKLNSDEFIRIHRSHIVNINKIKYMESASGGDYDVKLQNGQEARLSRRYKEALEKYLIK